MSVLVIDCGTTNLRVTLLDAQLNAADAVKADGGVRHTAIDGHNGRLKQTLRESIETLLARNGLGYADVTRCIAYGMITSNVGLLEVPHAAAPASAGDLREKMQKKCFPEIAPFEIEFIPGVRNFAGPVTTETFSSMDMMRGEETEAFGLYKLLHLTGPAVFILPGSHNKLVAMDEKGRIKGCMTSISGELLDALTHHTILADAVAHGFVSEEAYDAQMAMEGAWECAKSGLGRAAFAGRILHQLGKMKTEQIQSYLLGAALAQDVQAMDAFVSVGKETTDRLGTVIPFNRDVGAALGMAPNMSEAHEICDIYVAGKAPVQRAMCDVLCALGYEGASAVPNEVSSRMGICGAAEIAFGH